MARERPAQQEFFGIAEVLDPELGDLGVIKQRRRGHDPGRVIRSLAVMLADGGECVSDVAAVREQDALFGTVASDSTALRTVEKIASTPGPATDDDCRSGHLRAVVAITHVPDRQLEFAWADVHHVAVIHGLLRSVRGLQLADNASPGNTQTSVGAPLARQTLRPRVYLWPTAAERAVDAIPVTVPADTPPGLHVSDARRGGTRSLTRSGSRNERRSSPHGAGRRSDDSAPDRRSRLDVAPSLPVRTFVSRRSAERNRPVRQAALSARPGAELMRLADRSVDVDQLSVPAQRRPRPRRLPERSERPQRVGPRTGPRTAPSGPAASRLSRWGGGCRSHMRTGAS